MTILNKKLIVVISLVLITVTAAYLQYSYRMRSIAESTNSDAKIGDAAYVDSSKAATEVSTSVSVKTNNKTVSDTNPTKELNASKKAKDFFSQARMDRDSVIGADVDTLKEMEANKYVSNDVITKVNEQYLKLMSEVDQDSIIEALIKDTGYEDALVINAADGSIDIVVEAPSLNSVQVAEIADIVTSQVNMHIPDIHIKNIY